MCKPYKTGFMVTWNYPLDKHLPRSWHNFITFRPTAALLRSSRYTYRHFGTRVIDEDHLRFLSVKQHRHCLLSELVICGTKTDTWAEGPMFCIAWPKGTLCKRNNSFLTVNTTLKTTCIFRRNNFSHTRCNGSIHTCFYASAPSPPKNVLFLKTDWIIIW